MQSTKQLALVMTETSEEVKNEDKCNRLNDKCDFVLEKIKSKKAKQQKTVIEIK